MLFIEFSEGATLKMPLQMLIKLRIVFESWAIRGWEVRPFPNLAATDVASCG